MSFSPLLIGEPRATITLWPARARIALPFEVLRIHFREMSPLLRQIIQREDGRNRADRHAGTAIDALDWVDVSCVTAPKSASSFFGWMQSTGQASTHAVSFVPMQGSAMTYATLPSLLLPVAEVPRRFGWPTLRALSMPGTCRRRPCFGGPLTAFAIYIHKAF